MSSPYRRDMSCGLFVAEVMGSKSCAVCKKHIRDHKPEAIYIEPSKIFNSLPSKPRSSSTHNAQPALALPQFMSSLATSEHSAFSPYAKPVIHSNNLGNSARHLPPLIRPAPRLAVPSILPQEDRSDSCIYKKIRGKQKERSCSAAEVRYDSPADSEVAKSSLRSSPVPTQRSNDFKKILERFQSADQATVAPSPQPNRRFSTQIIVQESSPNRMSPTAMQRELWNSRNSRDAWSPTRTSSAPRESWSPAQRSSLNSPFRNSPVSRETSARSRMSMASMQSPLSFLPTRDCSPRSGPSPSLIPLRGSTSSEERHSPLSHTGSTPEPRIVHGRPPSSQHIPIPKRRSLPGRWIKETDIDAPIVMHSIGTPSTEGFSSEDALNSSFNGSKPPSMQGSRGELVKPKHQPIRFGGSVRHVLSGMDANRHNNSPNRVLFRRSRSKDDKLFYENGNHPKMAGSVGSISRATSHNIPIFMSNDSMNSCSPPMKMDREQEMQKHYQQIALSHVQTLSMVADRLTNYMRHHDEPVSRNRLPSLDFSHFVVQSQPILTKGKSLFYNAILPRPGMEDYPVTLMIAPCSQYAPLMRRNECQLFSVPSFLEIEDHDGSIRRFLEDTGTHNLDGRHTKAIAMPRLNLCSFHSLAAHHLNQRMDRVSHEELVCFILLQLMVALKMLQSEGVESLSTNFKEFLLAYRFNPVDSDSSITEFPRLIFLPETLGVEVENGEDTLVGLCKYALRALCTLLHQRMDGKAPPLKLRSKYSRALQACANLLTEDKSSSLTKAKNVLEYALWWSGDQPRSEIECRNSIDSARAECVDQLVRQLVCEPGCKLGARERFRVEFLLGATPRSVIDSHSAILNAVVV